jgi:hypothetical protein
LIITILREVLTVLEVVLVQLIDPFLLHKFGELLLAEGEEADEVEVVVDLEVSLLPQELLQTPRVEVLQMLIGLFLEGCTYSE